MKNTKLLFCMLLGIGLVLLPGVVNAGPAGEEVPSSLDNIVVSNNEDGSCTWPIHTVEFETLFENSCDFTEEDLLELYPGWASMSEVKLAEAVTNFNNQCKFNVVYSLFEAANTASGNKRWSFHIDRYELNGKELTLFDDSAKNGAPSSKTCNIDFNTVNDNDSKEVLKARSSLKNTYRLHGLDAFNAVYHYGPILDATGFNSDLVIYKFSDFKNTLMKYKKVDFDIAWDGAGATLQETGCNGWVQLSKNGVVYAMKLVSFTLDGTLNVDKDLTGTSIEKAENRLEKFFGNKVDVEISDNGYDVSGIGYFTDATIGEYTSRIMIKEVDKKDLDEYNVVAFDSDTDVSVNTDSYEVPIDSIINVSDKTNDMDKVFDKEMFKVHSAYDIDVVKMGNGGFVKTIENGIDVYLKLSVFLFRDSESMLWLLEKSTKLQLHKNPDNLPPPKS